MVYRCFMLLLCTILVHHVTYVDIISWSIRLIRLSSCIFEKRCLYKVLDVNRRTQKVDTPVLASQSSDALFQVIQQLVGGNQLILGLITVIPTCQTSVEDFIASGCTPFSIGFTCSVGGFFHILPPATGDMTGKMRCIGCIWLKQLNHTPDFGQTGEKGQKHSKDNPFLLLKRKNTLQDVKHWSNLLVGIDWTNAVDTKTPSSNTCI